MCRRTTSRDLSLSAREAKDSRGRGTVEVALELGGIKTVGDVPAGASKGEDEAKTMPVAEAVRAVHEVILPLLREGDYDLGKHDQLVAAEKKLVDKAGDNYAVIGANAVLPVSRALWRAAAAMAGVPLWRYIRNHEPKVAGDGRVHFLMNIFNGGLHALKKDQGERLGHDRIDIQEIMVVPVREKTYRGAMAAGEKIDQVLKSMLVNRFGAAAVTRGDEAGFTVKGLGDSTEAIALVFSAIEAAGYRAGDDIKLALDVAASSFYDAGTKTYQFQGKSISTAEMIRYLVGLAERYAGKILSIEDGLAENDWAGWTTLTTELKKRGVVTICDDLFVTQLPRLSRGIEAKAATAILVKVNQNGSISGTLEVMKRARAAGMHCVVSHRSGETLDDSIADLAYATGAFGLKTGDPQPPADYPDPTTWVRRRKYLRMIEIEEEA